MEKFFHFLPLLLSSSSLLIILVNNFLLRKTSSRDEITRLEITLRPTEVSLSDLRFILLVRTSQFSLFFFPLLFSLYQPGYRSPSKDRKYYRDDVVKAKRSEVWGRELFKNNEHAGFELADYWFLNERR